MSPRDLPVDWRLSLAGLLGMTLASAPAKGQGRRVLGFAAALVLLLFAFGTMGIPLAAFRRCQESCPGLREASLLVFAILGLTAAGVSLWTVANRPRWSNATGTCSVALIAATWLIWF